jgi:Kdo2-lipid IVA lauroyltransferase/acyltransferase
MTEERASVREWMEFAAVWLFVHSVRLLPRSWARGVGAAIGAAAFHGLGRLRKVGMRNLELAFPEKTSSDREGTLRAVYTNLGYLLAEFCKMPGYTAESASRFIRYEGLDNFLKARERGKGVLVLTGHVGAWELSSFYHSLMGYPMGMVIRRLDNRRLDDYVNGIRCMHGNRVLHKDEFARGLLTAMRAGETVGILMDTNMRPPQGVFVEFFGQQACTASGLARVALKSGAAVLPGFMVWEKAERKYVLRFGPELEFRQTGDAEADARAATQVCATVTEEWIRRYADQWLWIHRRWKTRPAGEPRLY